MFDRVLNDITVAVNDITFTAQKYPITVFYLVSIFLYTIFEQCDVCSKWTIKKQKRPKCVYSANFTVG